MIDYKFKEDDWFSTDDLTEEQYRLIEQEIYAQGIINCADHNGWSAHVWNERDWGVFSDEDDVLLFGSFGFGESENKLDTDMILKQIKESKMTDKKQFDKNNWYIKTESLTEDQIKTLCNYLICKYEEGLYTGHVKDADVHDWDVVGVTKGRYSADDFSGEDFVDDEMFFNTTEITYDLFKEAFLDVNDEQEVLEVTQSCNAPEPEFSLDKQAETICNLNKKLFLQQKEVEQIQLELKQAKELFDDLAKKACGEVSDEEPVVNDFENWKVGDTVKCLSADEKWFTEGDTYTIDRFDLGDNLPVLLSNEYWIEPNKGDEFIKVS